MKDDYRLYKAVLIKNTVVICLFTIIAIFFDKWGIVLFSVLFMSYVSKEDLPDKDWVPVKERLPESGYSKPVEITFLSALDGKTPVCGDFAVYDHEENCWRWWINNDPVIPISELDKVKVEVTAWKPMSEPYRG